MMMTNLSLTREEDQEGEEEESSKKQLIEESPREHMFDKVVTPSDVGKLNRLVIPKQHAERYFPLDSTSNEKGLLLNFEDLTGKSWRFRYSYWNSSQSYVMTKGWSRFVKDKKLDAGDIVSFQRSVGESSGNSNTTRLFIDWRRRPKVPEYPLHHFSSSTMFPRFYNFPTTTSTSYGLYQHHQQQQQQQRFHHQIPREFGYGYLVRSVDQQRNSNPTAVIDSVPVMMRGGGGGGARVHQEQGGKRLRLFGVDMECGEIGNSTEEESSSSNGSMPRGSEGGGLIQLRLGSGSSEDLQEHYFSKKGKSSCSLSFDLDQ